MNEMNRKTMSLGFPTTTFTDIRSPEAPLSSSTPSAKVSNNPSAMSVPTPTGYNNQAMVHRVHGTPGAPCPGRGRLTCAAGVDECRVGLIVRPPEALRSAHVEVGDRLAELETSVATERDGDWSATQQSQHDPQNALLRTQQLFLSPCFLHPISDYHC